MANIVIGVPTTGSVDTKTFESFMKMDKGEHKTCVLTTDYSLVYVARDNMCHKLLENPSASYILFVDSDIVFNKFAMNELIAENKDIISGLYAFKDGSGLAVGKDINGHDLRERDGKPTIEEVSAVGMGFCLIKREVIEAIMQRCGTCFEPMQNLGEDYSFCARAKGLGFKIYIDNSVKCKHVGKMEYEVK